MAPPNDPPRGPRARRPAGPPENRKGSAERPRGPRPKKPRVGGDAIPVFGGPRNLHGTRIARRVTCGRCGVEDHLPFTPKDERLALCRRCAIETGKFVEDGTTTPARTHSTLCPQCNTPFAIAEHVVDDGSRLCPPCYRGFAVWQGRPTPEGPTPPSATRRTGLRLRTTPDPSAKKSPPKAEP